MCVKKFMIFLKAVHHRKGQGAGFWGQDVAPFQNSLAGALIVYSYSQREKNCQTWKSLNGTEIGQLWKHRKIASM